MIEKSITSIEKTEFITEGELQWVKIKMKHNKDLLMGSFYMPHREQKHLDELQKSLDLINQSNITNKIITGDFNCPDINWNTETFSKVSLTS